MGRGIRRRLSPIGGWLPPEVRSQRFLELLELFGGCLRQIHEKCGHTGDLAPTRLFAIERFDANLKTHPACFSEPSFEAGNDVFYGGDLLPAHIRSPSLSPI